MFDVKHGRKKKMKIAFAGGPALERVFTKETVERIASLAGEAPVFGGSLPGDCEAVFSTWGMPSFTKKVIAESFPALKYVFYAAGSVQSFARPFLRQGVRVFSAWHANAVPVAEFTVAQIVLCGKRYFDVFTGAKASPRGNFGAKVGIIGMGAVGRLVCDMLKSYKLDVCAYDKFLWAEEFEKHGAKRADLETIFRECDVISNHLADNPDTRGMLGGTLLSLMKPDAYFINTGRGAQVDGDGLFEAMKAFPERTALLDVTWPEPLPEGHKLLSLPNVIVSPHIAGSLGSEVSRMGEYMLEEFERIIRGGEPLYEVNERLLEVLA